MVVGSRPCSGLLLGLGLLHGLGYEGCGIVCSWGPEVRADGEALYGRGPPSWMQEEDFCGKWVVARVFW
jgi:hypothetical protein